jgi:glycosyltransferase involved in cell wall biosynthesis
VSVHAIVANGFAEGPAEALRDYLVAHRGDVIAVSHPLTREHGSRHVVTRYAGGRSIESREIDLHVRPPASYALDSFVPLRLPKVDTWFGFNPLACVRGLAARRLGRARRVVLWSVDFVPDRFGAGTPATRLYDRLDRLCCTHADARVELSEAARTARDHRHGLERNARTHVVPMGAWLARVPTTPPDGFRRRRALFLGHLVERQGVDVLLAALSELDDVSADVIGSGPLEALLRRQADELGLGERVRFHGFVPDHRDVERLLAGASLALAPYRRSEDTFTRYADPGKLKAYLAAGLPTVLTPVPPNAEELAREAGAELVEDDPRSLAAAIASGLGDHDGWRRRREAALAYVRRFDWEVLLGDLIRTLQIPAR